MIEQNLDDSLSIKNKYTFISKKKKLIALGPPLRVDGDFTS